MISQLPATSQALPPAALVHVAVVPAKMGETSGTEPVSAKAAKTVLRSSFVFKVGGRWAGPCLYLMWSVWVHKD